MTTTTTDTRHPADKPRWIVRVDGDVVARTSTRAKAREEAAWWRRHPAVQDRRAHGPYLMGGARGAVEIIDRWERAR